MNVSAKKTMATDAATKAARVAPFRYAFVSSSADVGEAIRNFIDPTIESLSLKLASMEAAVPVARDLLDNGIEVVIGGGATGSLLAQTIGQCVVKLDRDPLDVVRALSAARRHGEHVGLTCFAKQVDGIELYESLLDLRITPVVFSSSRELSDGIESAAREGCSAIVGGGVCGKIAASIGLPGIVVIPRESSIRQTLKEARAVAAARRKERRDLQELRTILATSRDGMIVLDNEARLKFMNEAAMEVMRPLLPNGAAAAEAEVRAAMEPIGLINTLETGRPEVDRVRRIGPLDIVVSSAPIVVDGRTVGVVGTIREATRIQDIDRKVREKLYSKGFVARYRFEHIKGDHPGIRAVVERARHFARSDAAIMIEGETGTGKELLAQSIHNASPRSEKPFLGVNCSALSDSLLESELFGYEDGAFTGAKRGGKIGLFELAQGGTLFLDEVADISSALQLRLLRVIEEKEIMRLGGDRMVPVDVRIISSTQRRLSPSATASSFRSDLYFRLATLKLRIPPLRERTSDVPAILQSLFERHGCEWGGLSVTALGALKGHPWIGNLRELDSLVRTYIALQGNGQFSEAIFLEVFNELVFSTRGDGNLPEEGCGAGSLKAQVQSFERQIVMAALRQCEYDRGAAARKLGISLNSLWRKSRSPA